MPENEQTKICRVIPHTRDVADITNTQASLLFALAKDRPITTGRNSKGAAISWTSSFTGEYPIGWSHLVSRGDHWGGIPEPGDGWFILQGEEEGLSELSSRMDHLVDAIGEGWPVFIYTTPEGTGVITWERRPHGDNPAITINPQMEVSSWYDLPESLTAGMRRAPETPHGMLQQALDSVQWEPEPPGRERDEIPEPERTEQFIFTFEDRATRDEFLDLAQKNGVPARWTAVDPNPEYEHEHEFAYEEMFEGLAWTVIRTIEEDIENYVDEGEDRSGTGQYAWPDLAIKEWNQEDRRDRVRLAVTRWNHIGPNGAEPASVLRDHKAGLIPHTRTPT